MTKEQIKAKAKEQFPNDEFKQQAVIDAINWATKELGKENKDLEKRFTEAKEIIEGLLELGSIGDGDYTYVAEAEQFLKENA